jgi:RES domain-containing protein
MANGRWHRRDEASRVVYCASSLSLSVLEVRVHTALRPLGYVKMRIRVADDLVVNVESIAELRPDWQSDIESTRSIGTRWLTEGISVGLSVPSAIVADERNVLLNPIHGDFDKVIAEPPEPFEFDPRLYGVFH